MGQAAVVPESVRCPRCRASVAVVYVGNERVLIEDYEIEFPRTICPRCLRRKTRPPCERCGGTGYVGEVTPYYAIAIDEHGRARRWSRRQPRIRGEGLYHEHRC